MSKNEQIKKKLPRKGERKFEAACQEIQESISSYISSHDLDISEEDNSDEDESQVSSILEKVISGYENSEDVEVIQQNLYETFRSGAVICLICIENVKRDREIWSCEECCCIFHLGCIQKWAKDSIFMQSEEQEEAFSLDPYGHTYKKKDIKWSCPKCRSDYAKTSIPNIYKCFCGKKKNPSFDPWLIPHSCGEVCFKKLQPICGHSCQLLCHPGKCPPCATIVKVDCFCGKTRLQTKRCSHKEWTCGKVCRKLLSCQKHPCSEPCHPGDCKLCPKLSIQKCMCGTKTQKRLCTEPNWQCDEICNKEYSCGHHVCQLVCHTGNCGDCPLSGKRTCPCGKEDSILPCTKSVPSCGDTCSKLLSCGIHNCEDRCHKGSCPSCLQVRVKKCSCGAREKEISCSKHFTCDTKCRKMRDCRRHLCNKKCCLGDCPSCDNPCNKTLSCGKHKCESRCHPGACFPCYVTHVIKCTCGKTSITVPCGREKSTPIPKCFINCRKKSKCHHPVPLPHRCHPGECPPCKIICGVKLPCPHKCPAVCHDAIPTKIESTHKRSGPWEKIESPKIEIKKLPHPPCMIKVKNICVGKHETTEWNCNELGSYSCDRKCGRQLSCSKHKCEDGCHEVLNAPDNFTAGENCPPCDRYCDEPRPVECPHFCSKKCHPGLCPTCNVSMKLNCHCKVLKMVTTCDKWRASSALEQEKILSCTSRCFKPIDCGHTCTKECHGNDCSSPADCIRKVAVRCPCRRIRKDLTCKVVSSNATLVECDSACKKIIADKEMEARALAEKEENRRAFSKYEPGRKKRRRRNTHEEAEMKVPLWKNKYFIGIFVSVLLASAVYFIRELLYKI